MQRLQGMKRSSISVVIGADGPSNLTYIYDVIVRATAPLAPHKAF